MKRIVKTAVLVALFTVGTTSIFAAQQTTSIAVTASVSSVCTISTTTNLDFGAYDPVNVNAAAAKNETAPAVVSVSCTKGTAPTVDFAAASGTMTNGTDTLNFNLFTNAGHTIAFGPAAVSLSFAAGKAAQTVNVYGQIPGGQDVGVGAYNGSVTARVNY